MQPKEQSQPLNNKIYLVAGKRTPFGKFGGALKDITPVDLTVSASKQLLAELKLNPALINHVILGNVVPSSTDTMYGARHVALKVGLPVETPAYIVNRLCGSGLQAIGDAARLIRLGEAQCVLAAGTENMSMVPHLTYGGRFGTKYGALKTVDMLLDALTDQYINMPMGITAENLAEQFAIKRDLCEEYSARSHQKAMRAYEDKVLTGEIAPIDVKGKIIERDEHLRFGATLEEMKEQMRTLNASFKKDGVVTPATASGIVDGAASVLVASAEFCEKNNLTPVAEIVESVVVGVDPKVMGIGPSTAIRLLLEKTNMSMSQIDFFEINEAFAAQVLACVKDLKVPQERLNIWGGAIALGHPLAASGARLALTLSRQLKRFQGNFGIASACIGGGQGIAMLLKRVF